VPHCGHCAKGKKRQRQLTYKLFSLIAGIKTNMLLIIFLGLIAKLTSVSGQCDVGTSDVTDLNWNRVSVRLLTGFLKRSS
jgi:hypothetical protein